MNKGEAKSLVRTLANMAAAEKRNERARAAAANAYGEGLSWGRANGLALAAQILAIRAKLIRRVA